MVESKGRRVQDHELDGVSNALGWQEGPKNDHEL